MKHIGLDSRRCRCVLRSTYGLPCVCRCVPLDEIHVMWIRLSFSSIVSIESHLELCIEHELDMVQERFKKADIGENVNINQKLVEIACPIMTSMVPPSHKVKIKGAQKAKLQRNERSTKGDPSYFEHVVTLYSMIESSSPKVQVKSKAKSIQ